MRWPQPPREPPRPQRTPRVLFYTAPWVMQNPGGGEVQLLKTAEYLAKLGVEAKLLDPWSDRLSRADWLHVFGTLPECLTMARLAKRCGLRVALSPILWYDPRASWRLETRWRCKLRAIAGWAVRRLYPRLRSWRRELIDVADLLLPNSTAEATQLGQLFGADASRIVVVPNGVDVRFSTGDPAKFHAQFGVRDFVLMTGRIEPRKNQLGVIRALQGSNIPLVVLGEAHLDHAAYYNECRREADAHVVFTGRIEHDSPLLASAYAASRVVVLASWFETPGLAALEGALAGAQVVVTRRGSAHEYFESLARYVEPHDVGGIGTAIRSAIEDPRDGRLREHVEQRFLWNVVAEKTLAAYERTTGGTSVSAPEPTALAA